MRKRSFPAKPLSPGVMSAHRIARQEGIFALVNDLHTAGFGTLWIESQQVGHDDYWLRVIVDRPELGSEDIDALMQVAEEHRARVSMRRDFGRDESRLALFISSE